MDLLQNPFYILTATLRDNQQRILDLADERSLLLDANECMAARLALTTPRKRLAAEIAWLPGVSPKRAADIVALLKTSPSRMLQQNDLPSLAYANALEAGLLKIQLTSPQELSLWIIQLALSFDAIDMRSVLQMINEERAVSGFTEVSDISSVEDELQSKRYEYRKAIKTVFEGMPFEKIVETITIVVETVTHMGEKHAPVLIDDLVDAYEIDVQAVLEEKEKIIKALLEQLKTGVETEASDDVLVDSVDELISSVKDWDLIAQPIQVSTKSRGLEHGDSVRVAGEIRSVAVDLWNQHGKLELAQTLTDMLLEVFAEVVTVAERTSEDGSILDDLAKQKKLEAFLIPIALLRNEIFEKTKKYPYDIGTAARNLIRLAPPLFDKLCSADAPASIVQEEKESIAMLLIYCSIEYGNKTGKWEECIKILEEANSYTYDRATEQRIAGNIKIAHANILEGKHKKSKEFKIWVSISIIFFSIIWYAIHSTGNKQSYRSSPSSSSSSYSQQSSATPTTRYEKPTGGTGNVLSMAQIRWCVREQIRLDTMEPRTQSNTAVSHFNSLVNDYNIRCTNFRYRKGDFERAQQEVAQDRAQIVNDAIREINLH